MAEWEYLEAYVYQDEWIDSSGRRKLVQGKKMKVRDAQVHFTATSALNELGSRGWELVGVGFTDMSLFRLFLKRPKPADKRFVPIREIEPPIAEQPVARSGRSPAAKGVVALPRQVREVQSTVRVSRVSAADQPETRAAQ
jgi:hypothetical protein